MAIRGRAGGQQPFEQDGNRVLAVSFAPPRPGLYFGNCGNVSEFMSVTSGAAGAMALPVMLAIVSAIIGPKVRLAPRSDSTHRPVVNFWCTVLGSPGSGACARATVRSWGVAQARIA
jgi:hypothetical protein